MRSISAALFAASQLALGTVHAQTPSTTSGGFEKKNYNYSEWTKGLFSEVL
jgi:hypothetical protein